MSSPGAAEFRKPRCRRSNNDRVKLGVERAKVLARTLKCHPAVLAFPGWDVARDSAHGDN